MANAATVNINVTDLTQSVTAPLTGTNFIMGRSVRGPFADPSEIINSWNRFVEKYGGLTPNSDTPLLVKRLLDKGGSIRFSRVGHYTTITDRASLDAVKAEYPTAFNILLDGPFVTDNVMDLDINGDAIGPINFTIDNEGTVEEVVANIEAHEDVKECYSNILPSGAVSFIVVPKNNIEIIVDNVTITGGDTQTNTTVGIYDGVTDGDGIKMFKLVLKYPGADGNNFTQIISAPSNGAQGYFNLLLKHNIEPSLNELYQNLKFDNTKTYLDKVVQNSKHFDVIYFEGEGVTGAPLYSELQLTGGSDGTLPDEIDYIGDSSSRTGFHAFDQYDDSYNLGVFDNTTDDVLVAGAAYVASREDLIFFLELPPSIKDKTAMISKRTTLNIDNKYVYIFGGGLEVKDPITNQDKEIMGMADVMALENYTSKNFGPWYSFAGNNRGVITGAMGVVNNYGAAGNYRDLNDLANQQINMVINRDKAIKLWGNFSAQVATTQQSQLSIVKLIIFLKKSLRPTLEGFLEEPNDIPTWKRMYYTVLPFLDSLVTRRALYSYDWQGDQFAKNLDTLQVNDKTDVGNGKYKILLPIKAIPSLQEINVNIILTPAGVDFSTTTELI